MPGSRSVLASEKGGRAVGKQTSKKTAGKERGRTCKYLCTAVANETREMETADVIQYFHNSIKCAPKYIMCVL